jgi:hypothetical protein
MTDREKKEDRFRKERKQIEKRKKIDREKKEDGYSKERRQVLGSLK